MFQNIITNLKIIVKTFWK